MGAACPFPSISHDLLLPSSLREFQVELAGRLAMHEQPGPEMKGLRERYGFTQDFMAAALDLRRESVSRIEGGKVALTLPILQRFTRVITLARGVREHLAWAEARNNLPDERHLDMLAQMLRVERPTADDVVLASMMSYDRKKREALRQVPPRRRFA